MSYIAVTLRVISTLFIVLGLGILASLVVVFTLPENDLMILLMYAPLLPLLWGAIRTFRPFHELRWPAIDVAKVGALMTLGGLFLLRAGWVESARPPQGPLDGIGGAILTLLSHYALVGAGALLLGASLSLLSHRFATPAN